MEKSSKNQKARSAEADRADTNTAKQRT